MSENQKQMQNPYPRGIGTGAVPVLFSLRNVQPSLVKANAPSDQETGVQPQQSAVTPSISEALPSVPQKIPSTKSNRFGNRVYNGVVTILVAMVCVLVIRNSRNWQNGSAKPTTLANAPVEQTPKSALEVPKLASQTVTPSTVISSHATSNSVTASNTTSNGLAQNVVAPSMAAPSEGALQSPFASAPLVLGRPTSTESTTSEMSRNDSPSLELLSVGSSKNHAATNSNAVSAPVAISNNRPAVDPNPNSSTEFPVASTTSASNTTAVSTIPLLNETRLPSNATSRESTESTESGQPSISLTTGLNLSSNMKPAQETANKIIDTSAPNLSTSQLIAAYQAMNGTVNKNASSGVEAMPVSAPSTAPQNGAPTTSLVPYVPIHSSPSAPTGQLSNPIPAAIQQPVQNSSAISSAMSSSTLMSGEAYPPMPKYQPNTSVPLAIPAYEQNAQGMNNNPASMIRQPGVGNSNRYNGTSVQQPAPKQPYTPMYGAPTSSTVGNSSGYPPERN